MIPEDYREFFVAAAGATGALIGLLFVAVSVFPEQARQSTTRLQFQTRSSAALLVFTNALVISMAALVPGVSLGWWAIVSGSGILLFAAATTRSIAGQSRQQRKEAGWTWMIVGLLVIAGWELWAGIRLAIAPDAAPDLGAVRALSYVIIGDLLFGIARAWQLLGLRDTGWTTSLRTLTGRDAAGDDQPH